MSDPGDKSDDLISELAKLMASSASGGEAAVKPITRPAPLNPAATSPGPIRIPGMDAGPAYPAPILPNEAPRAPVTGTIRIPGMDQPAPVTTSAPVSKFDFGKAPVAPAMRPEPVLTPAAPAPRPMAPPPAAAAAAPRPVSSPPPAPRVPSDLKPVSENRSFGEGPVLRPTPMPPPVADSSLTGEEGFKFDFGLDPGPERQPSHDPIADLIAAELKADASPQPAAEPGPPVFRTQMSPAPAPVKPTFAPVAAPTGRPANPTPIPLKPVSASPRPQESDRFAISPGIGLNGRPAANQPLNPQPLPPAPPPSAMDDLDPMAEIESLIGEAVRVELTPGPVKVQAPIEPQIEREPESPPPPVVPPLNTQFAPRRSGLADHSDDAERAIMAATADSGGNLGRLDGSMTEESPYRRLKVKPQNPSLLSGGMRQYVGMAVAGTLLLAAGLGLYWVLNMGRGSTPATAPVLTADTTPVKVAPAPEVSAEAETARSPVLEQLDGTSAEPSAEQLVSTDETGGQDVARVVGTEPESTEDGLANRKVRTVTVRPDGTIVPGDDAVAGAEELPIDRPNVPEIPGATGDTVNLLDGTDTAGATDSPIDVAGTDPVAALVETAPADVSGATADTAPVSGAIIDPTKVAPVPAPAPNRAAMLQNLETQPLAAVDETPAQPIDVAPVEETPVAAAPADTGGAAAYVQLSSSPSQADAESAARAATARFGSLFGGGQLVVMSADLGQKGTWYRVRLPAGSLAEATRICNEIKANGGDCIATNG